MILDFLNFSQGHDGFEVFLKKIIYFLMSKWKFLGEYEKGQIDAYFQIGKNIKQIGAILERSRTAIKNYVTSKNVNIITNKKGIKRTLSFRRLKKFKVWILIKP